MLTYLPNTSHLHFILRWRKKKVCIQSIVVHIYPDKFTGIPCHYSLFFVGEIQETNPLIIFASVIGRVLKNVKAGEIQDIGKQRDKQKVV